MFFKPADIDDIATKIRDLSFGIFPCDTLLGCVGLVSESVYTKIATIKQRQEKPFLVLISSLDQLHDWVEPLSARQQKILIDYWPGPISFIFKKKSTIPDYVTCGFDTICVRFPEFLPLNYLLNQLGHPIFSTSVNLHNQPAIDSISECPQYIKKQMDFIYSPFSSRHHKPSTLVDLSSDTFSVVRQGAMLFHDEA